VINKTDASMTATIAFPGMLLAAPTIAQSPQGGTTQDDVSLHHQRQYQMMKDMTDEMAAMTEQMRAELPPGQRAEMGLRMGLMSTMMRRMSGLEARPAMNEAKWQLQMDQMRQQMDAMMGAPSMKPSAK
jgi:hypothetical protein